jgi:hypothetical protein
MKEMLPITSFFQKEESQNPASSKKRTATSESAEETLKKHKRTSWVWQHFKEDVSSQTATCKVKFLSGRICGEKYSIGKSNTAMNRHLVAKHPEIFTKEKGLTLLDNFFGPALHSSFDQKKAGIIQWIIRDLQPLSATDRPAFQEMIHRFDSSFPIPGRKAVTSEVESFFFSSKAMVCRQL